MTRMELINIFTNAKKNKNDICVEITIPGQEDTEFIINKNKSINNKLEYYLETYDENMVHNRNKDIKIIRAFPIDFYAGK